MGSRPREINMIESNSKYDVFISYSRRDKDIVLSIKDEIERTLGLKCWIDLEGIESGKPEFTKEIAKAISGSATVLFFLSTASQTSPWTCNELRVACKKEKHAVIIRFNDDPVLDEFMLEFGGRDTIDWRQQEQKEKLLRDLRSWADELIETLMTEAGRFYSEDNCLKAADIYQRCAERGSALASYRLGEIHELGGNGVERNKDVAFEWYCEAARLGDADMQYRVGVKHYDAGYYKQAVKLFFDAAKGGQRDAQVNLGKMLEHGRGVKKDETTAFKWYYEAAKRGDIDSQYAIGLMYEQGRGGMTKDIDEARKWYRVAAERGSTDAQRHLAGLMKENGFLCKMLRMLKVLVVAGALLGLVVVIAIITLLFKFGVIG